MKQTPATQKRRYGGQRALTQLIQQPLKASQKKRGFAESRILTEWPTIVGAALAAHCVPEKLTYPKGQPGATLHLLCESSWALELQFQQPILCEKIALFFGYRAVSDIRIRQGVLPKAPRKAPLPKDSPSPAVTQQVAETVAVIEDDGLRAALMRLGLSRSGASAIENPPHRAHINETGDEPNQKGD